MFSKYPETHLCWLSVVWVRVSLSYTLVERSINVSKLRQISKLTTTGPESKWITTQLSQPQTQEQEQELKNSSHLLAADACSTLRALPILTAKQPQVIQVVRWPSQVSCVRV